MDRSSIELHTVSEFIDGQSHPTTERIFDLVRDGDRVRLLCRDEPDQSLVFDGGFMHEALELLGFGTA